MKLKKQIMCKSVCFTFLVFVLLSFSGHVFAQRAFLIYNSEGEQVDFDQVIQETEGKSHIFLVNFTIIRLVIGCNWNLQKLYSNRTVTG